MPSSKRHLTRGGSLASTLVLLAACAGQPALTTSASRSTLSSRRDADTPATTSAATSRSDGVGTSAMERGVLDEINRVRTNPSGYADVLEASLRYYNGTIYRRPGDPVALQTREGVPAVREAISALRATSPLAPLRFSQGMALGARDHVQDQAPRGLMNHRGTDGSMAWDRVGRYGEWKSKVSENMTFGPESPRDVVYALVVDDGIRDRGHRHNILDPEMRVAGVVCAPHKTYRLMCDMVHAVGFSDRG